MNGWFSKKFSGLWPLYYKYNLKFEYLDVAKYLKYANEKCKHGIFHTSYCSASARTKTDTENHSVSST